MSLPTISTFSCDIARAVSRDQKIGVHAKATPTTADTVKRYVDENIAHSDARRTAAVATFNDLDAGIDAIGDLYAKYTLALTAVGYVTLVPVIQHNWKAIFTRPWIEPPPHLRRSTPER